MKKILITAACSLLIFSISCGDSNSSAQKEAAPAAEPAAATASDTRGVGKFTKVDVGTTLDAAMATLGNKVYDVKCASCHKLTDEKLVGPGWKGVTSRRAPEWVMNFVTNTDEMLNKDAAAQAQLEICLVRMPNQNLTDDDARHVLEFMRKNDGVK